MTETLRERIAQLRTQGQQLESFVERIVAGQQERIIELRAANALALEALRAVESVNEPMCPDYGSERVKVCPLCCRYYGHTKNCKIGTAITALESCIPKPESQKGEVHEDRR